MYFEPEYIRNYQSTMEVLEQSYAQSTKKLHEIEAELESLYSYEGLGWAGRGMKKEAEIHSTIAAYEAFLSGVK